MIVVHFKNLRRSEFIEMNVKRAFASLLDFSQTKGSVLAITVEMQNSPLKAGKDHFVVKCRLLDSQSKSLFVNKSGENVFEVIHTAAHVLQERLRKQKKKESTSRRRLSS